MAGQYQQHSRTYQQQAKVPTTKRHSLGHPKKKKKGLLGLIGISLLLGIIFFAVFFVIGVLSAPYLPI